MVTKRKKQPQQHFIYLKEIFLPDYTVQLIRNYVSEVIGRKN